MYAVEQDLNTDNLYKKYRLYLTNLVSSALVQLNVILGLNHKMTTKIKGKKELNF